MCVTLKINPGGMRRNHNINEKHSLSDLTNLFITFFKLKRHFLGSEGQTFPPFYCAPYAHVILRYITPSSMFLKDNIGGTKTNFSVPVHTELDLGFVCQQSPRVSATLPITSVAYDYCT